MLARCITPTSYEGVCFLILTRFFSPCGHTDDTKKLLASLVSVSPLREPDESR